MISSREYNLSFVLSIIIIITSTLSSSWTGDSDSPFIMHSMVNKILFLYYNDETIFH